MPISNRNVLVSGGGVSGTALALWLARKGFAPTVVDSAPGPRAEGDHVEVSRRGMELLDRMGQGERIRHLGSHYTEIRTHISGRDQPILMPFQSGGLLLRHEQLVRALREAADKLPDPGVRHRDGDTITDLAQDDDGVDVTFARAPAERFDLVVGADGLYSPVRRLAFPGSDDDHLRYLEANVATFESPNVLGTRDALSWHVWPHRGCVAATLPGNERLQVQLLMRDRFPVYADSLDQGAEHRLVEEVFGEDGWRMPELLRAMADTDVSIVPATRVRMDVWSRGRVVLVGDAAYCPDRLSGQGPATALMGALALAGELSFAEGDHGRAFFSYEAAMRHTVREAQAVARHVVETGAPEAGPYEMWVRERTEAALTRGSLLLNRLGLRPPMDPVGEEFALERYAPMFDD
ncbi:hypothetical protein DSY14_02715 [Nocardiopsis sp. MG754419]|nr:hypothetical protein [Nocardiopsis sp. MG754419]